MWTHHRSNCVIRVFNSCHPITHGFVDCIFQRATSRLGRDNFGAKQAHSKYVQCLSLDVHFSHVHLALKTKQCCCSCRCNTVLSSACLGNDALLAHALRQQHLTEHTVDLVGTRVIQIFTLQDQANSKFSTEVVAFRQD